MKRQRMFTTAIILAAILSQACGAQSFAKSLRIVLAGSAPALSRLVAHGTITESFRLQLVADLNEEAGYVQELANCLDAATDKPAKLVCVQTLETQTRPVLERHFRQNDNVSMIADDIEAVIQVAIIFYGGGALRGVKAGGAERVVTEADIKARIEILKKDLGQ